MVSMDMCTLNFYCSSTFPLFLLEAVNKLLKYKGLFQSHRGNVQEAMKRIRHYF